MRPDESRSRIKTPCAAANWTKSAICAPPSKSDVGLLDLVQRVLLDHDVFGFLEVVSLRRPITRDLLEKVRRSTLLLVRRAVGARIGAELRVQVALVVGELLLADHDLLHFARNGLHQRRRDSLETARHAATTERL